MRLPWQSVWRPVSVLTGFLGSGKTSCLHELLQDPAMAGTALIINEFGEISIDHLLVENVDEQMVLLSNGCVCCSVRGDLVQAVQSLFARMKAEEIPPFQRILLETTGLADPAPIVQSLIGPALRHYPVYFDSIATTLDLSNALAAIPSHPQIQAQVAVADTVLLTKPDLASEESRDDLKAWVRQINPRAAQQEVLHGRVDTDRIFGQRLLDPTASPRDMRLATERMFADLSTSHLSDTDIHSFVIERDKPLSYAALEQFLRTLRGYKSQDLLRMKGLVHIAGSPRRPFVVHGVQAVMHPPIKLRRWPTAERKTRLVFIARNLRRDDVDKLLTGIEAGFR